MPDRPARITVYIEPCTGRDNAPCHLDRVPDLRQRRWLVDMTTPSGSGEPNFGALQDALAFSRY